MAATSNEKPQTGFSSLSTWVSPKDWTERIISFNASWFVASMSTGVVVQVLVNFPYPAQWLRDIAYCLWVLTICLFVFFSSLGVIRTVRYPRFAKAVFDDFFQTSFLGAIPITIDGIGAGIVIFYSDRMTAIWAAYALYWAVVTLALIVGCLVVFYTCAIQEAPELSSVTGVWLLSFIPLLVTTGVGALIIPHLPLEIQGFTIVVTFLLWSVGIIMCMFILVIYFWRLIQHKLPPREAIASCFVPVGPSAMGAYGIHSLGVAAASYITKRNYTLLLLLPPQPPAPTSHDTAALAITTATFVHWLSVATALLLLGFSTFWLLQAVLAIVTRPLAPRFNTTWWSLVFPCGVYANATGMLAADLGSTALRGWSAAASAATALLWLFCAAGSLYGGVWRADLFFAPGREGQLVRRALGRPPEDTGARRTSAKSLADDSSAGSGFSSTGPGAGVGASPYVLPQVAIGSGSGTLYSLSRSSERGSGWEWQRSQGGGSSDESLRPVEDV